MATNEQSNAQVCNKDGQGGPDNPNLNQNDTSQLLLQAKEELSSGANEFNQRLGQPSIDEPDQSFHDLDMANHTLKRPRNDLNNVGMQSMGQNQQQQNPISQAAAQRSCNSSYHSQDEEEKEKREMEQNQDAQTVKRNLKKQIHKHFRDLKVQNVKKVAYGENSVLEEYNKLTGVEQQAISIIQKVKKVPKIAIKFTFHLRFLFNDQIQATMHTLLALGDTSTIVLLAKQKNSFNIAQKFILNAMFNVIGYKITFKKTMDKKNQEHVRELNGLEEEIKYLESVIDALEEQDPNSYQRRQEQINMVQQQWVKLGGSEARGESI